jgi:hypothetical protein
MGVDVSWMRAQDRASWLLAAAVAAVIGIVVLTVTVSAGARAAATTAAAKPLVMKEKAEMHLTSVPSTTFQEKGRMTGTFAGSITAYVTGYSVSKGAFTMTAYMSGGTISAQGTTHNHTVGPTGYAEGTVQVTRGTGRFAHATSKGMRLRAVIDRENFHVTSEISGTLSF